MSSWAAIARTVPTPQPIEETLSETKPRVAVIDANAIIHGDGLLNLMRVVDRVVTIPEVLKEIRDSKSRNILNTLPYRIETQDPSEEDVRAGRYKWFCM